MKTPKKREREQQGRPMVSEHVVSVRMTHELKEQIQTMADAERRPLANMIRVILEDGVKAWRRKS